MAWANEPVVFTSLTIHFHVVKIVKMKANRSSANTRGKELALKLSIDGTANDMKFIVLLLNKAKGNALSQNLSNK